MFLLILTTLTSCVEVYEEDNMAIANTTIPNLISGVSTQDDRVMNTNQAKEVVNFHLSPELGAVKRPSRWYKTFQNLDINNPEEAYYFTWEDSTGTVNTLILDGISAYIVKGNTFQSVDISTTSNYLLNITRSPREAYRAVQLGDSVSILNRDKVVEEVDGAANYQTHFTIYRKGFMVELKNVSYSSSYTLKVSTSSGDFIRTVSTWQSDWKDGDNVDEYLATVEEGATPNYILNSLRPDADLPPTVDTEGNRYPYQPEVAGTSSTYYTTETHFAGGNFYTYKVPNTRTTEGQEYFRFPLRQDLDIETDNTKLDIVWGASSGLFVGVQDGILIVYEDPYPSVTINSVELISEHYGEAYNYPAEVDNIGDLPPTSVHSVVMKVRGSEASNLDDYWVQYDASEGIWKECLEPEQSRYLTEDAPVLYYPSENSILSNAPAQRGVGNDTTNPPPSFFGNTIEDMFVFKNRLAYVSEGVIVFSEQGDIVSPNFFRNSTLSLPVTEPFELSLAYNEGSRVRYTLPYNDSLYLFSDQAQFRLDSQGGLTSTSVSASLVSNYDVDLSVPPVLVGDTIYYLGNNGSNTSVYEYTTHPNSDRLYSVPITQHVPNYIGEIKGITGNSINNTLVLLDTEGNHYVYKWLDQVTRNGTERIQSAWSKWEYCEANLHSKFIGAELHGVTLRSGTTTSTVPTYQVTTQESTYAYDNYTSLPTDWLTGNTYYSTFNSMYDDDCLHFIYNDEQITPEEADTLHAAGETVYAGSIINCTYKFNKFRLEDGQTIKNHDTLKIKNVGVNYTQSRSFTLTTDKGMGRSSEYTYYNEDREDGYYQIPILADVETTEVTLTDNSIHPLRLQALELEFTYTQRSRRV